MSRGVRRKRRVEIWKSDEFTQRDAIVRYKRRDRDRTRTGTYICPILDGRSTRRSFAVTLRVTNLSDHLGGTENARPENMARSKLQDWKTQDWKTRHQTAGLENAELENVAPNCRTEKRGKRHVWKAKLLTPHAVVILV